MRTVLGLVAVTGALLLGSSACSRSVAADDGAAGSRTESELEASLDVLEASLASERADWLQKERALLERIDGLSAELQSEAEGREEREREWLAFTRALSTLEVPEAPVPPSFVDQLAARAASVDAPDEVDAPELDSARARNHQALVDLRSLLLLEQVLGLDFLEVGAVNSGWAGPVVVRLLDDRARPTGTLAAERFRLEASRAGRSITLVFEEGYERYGGATVTFDGFPVEDGERSGSRRIHLPEVDPEPWIAALPELFDDLSKEARPDDGLWRAVEVRTELNDLLRGESRAGHWRLRSLAGVVGAELRDVQLVQLDVEGHVRMRLFADRLRILPQEGGVVLLLEDGITERHGRRAPFLEGRYRIFLPRVHAPAWDAATLPGLSPPPS